MPDETRRGEHMTEYFSDRETGPAPRVNDEIDQITWNGILSLIENRINDGSLAHDFPETCPDGNAIAGTDKDSLRRRVRSEIPDLCEENTDYPPPWQASSDVLPPETNHSPQYGYCREKQRAGDPGFAPLGPGKRR